MSNFEELKYEAEHWAHKNGILDKGTTRAQADKTLEEAQELKDAIILGDLEQIIDGIGDVLVTVIVQARMQGMDPLGCLAVSLDTIRDRDGEMIDGEFVRQE